MKLKDRHPAVILFFFAAVLVLTLSTHHPAIALMSLLSAFLLRVRLAGIRKAARSLPYLVPMTLLMILFNSLFNDRGLTVLFSIRRLSVTLESVLYGLVSGLMLSAVMLWFQSYNNMMDSGRFLALMGRRLPVISMMISMIFRLIPESVAHGHEIEMSRRALLGEPKGRFRLAGAIRMTTVLMAWSMENAIETADAMRAKAFDAGRRRAYGRIRRSARDIPPMAAMALFLALAAAGALAGGSAFLYYPFLAVPTRARAGWAMAGWLTGSAALFAVPFLADALSVLSDRIREARRQRADTDPFVTAMVPRIKSGGPQ
ncbi:MAG TPA: energy-coupling factor transporter transmembrane component T [Bacillota bacterium]|jgi:energy-coupling factor transport system permease protein|nr:hypothetical protein [Fastidiosipila sp.]HPX92845.1 energy-coupling factor transporter transmembrane component T [Bacillota bacterium]HQB81330.1 energy-coupling factor transporter transmembrane component T [Bacillota bacterium]